MTYRPSFVRLGLLLTLPVLGGACRQAKLADPAPTAYAVRVHVTGSDMLSGSAIIRATTNYTGANGTPVEQPVKALIYATTVDETYELGKFGTADRIKVRIELSGNTYKAFLQAEILVDGVVKNKCFVTGGGVFETCEVTTDKL